MNVDHEFQPFLKILSVLLILCDVVAASFLQPNCDPTHKLCFGFIRPHPPPHIAIRPPVETPLPPRLHQPPPAARPKRPIYPRPPKAGQSPSPGPLSPSSPPPSVPVKNAPPFPLISTPQIPFPKPVFHLPPCFTPFVPIFHSPPIRMPFIPIYKKYPKSPLPSGVAASQDYSFRPPPPLFS